MWWTTPLKALKFIQQTWGWAHKLSVQRKKKEKLSGLPHCLITFCRLPCYLHTLESPYATFMGLNIQEHIYTYGACNIFDPAEALSLQTCALKEITAKTLIYYKHISLVQAWGGWLVGRRWATCWQRWRRRRGRWTWRGRCPSWSSSALRSTASPSSFPSCCSSPSSCLGSTQWVTVRPHQRTEQCSVILNSP